jgi:hypothetical protein
MSKRKKSRRNSVSLKQNDTAHEFSERTAMFKVGAPLVILILGAIAFGAFLNFNSPLMKSGGQRVSTSVQPLPTPDYAAAKPAKEYVYGAGKLVAVSEQENVAPTDLAVWRLSAGNGTWWVLDQDGSNTVQGFGLSTDKPAPGDYDGDGKTDFCVFRPGDGQWHVLHSGSGNTYGVYTFGSNGDKPVPADYNGDGKTELALYRASNNTWYLQDTTSGFIGSWVYGSAGDAPVPSDYDGDGKADLAQWRDGNATWYVMRSSDGAWTTQQWGTSGAGDKPVPGDYDGDGKTDFAVWQASNGWKILNASTGPNGTTTTWGYKATDIEVQGDYDADGKTDIACWRPTNGTWYIIESTRGQRIQPWGSDGDIPVPAPYRR